MASSRIRLASASATLLIHGSGLAPERRLHELPASLYRLCVKPLAPSRLAAAAASKLWGRLQDQQRLCSGAFWFSTPSDGGIIAFVNSAAVPETAARAARSSGLLDTIGVRRGKKNWFELRSDAGTRWPSFIQVTGVELADVWPAEEESTSRQALLGTCPAIWEAEATRMVTGAAWKERWPQEHFLAAVEAEGGIWADFVARYRAELERIAPAPPEPIAGRRGRRSPLAQRLTRRP